MPSTQQRCDIPGCLFTSKATGTKISVSFQHYFFRKHALETLYRWKYRCRHLLSPKEAHMKMYFNNYAIHIASLPPSPTPELAPIYPYCPLEEYTSELSTFLQHQPKPCHVHITIPHPTPSLPALPSLLTLSTTQLLTAPHTRNLLQPPLTHYFHISTP